MPLWNLFLAAMPLWNLFLAAMPFDKVWISEGKELSLPQTSAILKRALYIYHTWANPCIANLRCDVLASLLERLDFFQLKVSWGHVAHIHDWSKTADRRPPVQCRKLSLGNCLNQCNVERKEIVPDFRQVAHWPHSPGFLWGNAGANFSYEEIAPPVTCQCQFGQSIFLSAVNIDKFLGSNELKKKTDAMLCRQFWSDSENCFWLAGPDSRLPLL